MSYVAPVSLSIHPFRMELDSVWLHSLWHRTLHPRWALPLAAMQHTLSDADLLLVADYQGLQSGFCAVEWRRRESAALILILVDPSRQRVGIGTELMRAVETKLRQDKTRTLSLGAGHNDYFWPGLPQEQESAWPFFAKQGFQEQEPSEDLIQSLETFHTPRWVAARQLATATTLHLAEPAWAERINAFERRHFPVWASYFEREMKQSAYADILFAQGSGGEVLGTVLLKQNISVPWEQTRGTRVGTLNTLGVAPHSQGRGVGMALAAGAMEHLRDRGCSSCYIQWTGMADWYGKLGATPWAHYHMASKKL